jgi:NADH:ubiquinone oxidoreductase subunit 6 (subunit J)
MALTMIILGVFYIAQGADFLGVIQIFVYTGAVMMLFLFVHHARRRRLLRQPRGDPARASAG